MIALPRSFVVVLAALSLIVVECSGVFAQVGVIDGTSYGSVQVAQQAQSTDPRDEPTIQQSADYRIRQGDDLTLVVYGEPTLSPTIPLRVLQGGAIAVPLAGNVKVAGLTTGAASRAVRAKLRFYLRDPIVTLAVARVGLVEALVLGNVKTPGKYVLAPPAKLSDAIAAAGGLGPTDGKLPEARLEAPDGSVQNVSLEHLFQDGDVRLDRPIPSGETVYIPSPIVFSVRVIGAVDKPGDVLLHEGDDVAMAIARAGTSQNSAADLNHVVVTRTDAAGKTSAQNVNLYEILKQGDLSHDVKMQKNDLVYVPQAGRRDGSPTGFNPLGILRRFLPFGL